MTSTEIETIVRDSFARQDLMTTLGATLTRVEDGAVEIVLPFGEHITQQHGSIHAGAIASIADSACGYACLTQMPAGSAILTVEFKINYVAPAFGERFVARGRTVRVGRTIGVSTADVVAVDAAGAETAVAVMQATMMRLEPRDGKIG